MREPYRPADTSLAYTANDALAPTLIALCAECGLANRLRLMANLHLLAAYWRLRFAACWRAAVGCNAQAADLFDLTPSRPVDGSDGWAPGFGFVADQDVETIDRLWRSPRAYPYEYGENLKRLRDDGFVAALVDAPGMSDLSLEGLAPEQVRQYKSRFYAALPIRTDLRATANAQRDAWPIEKGEPVVGIHIRRFVARHDALDGYDFDQLSSLAAFRRVMDAFPADVRFAVCSNDPHTIGSVCDWYPRGRAFALRASSADYSRDSVHGVREALVDMLLLGGCAAIIGTYHSSFSDEAALFAGLAPKYCPLTVAGLERAGTGNYHAAGFTLEQRAGVLHAGGHPAILGALEASPLA